MKMLRVLLSVVLLAGGLQFPAQAHSWYPNECCSHDDCMPADNLVTGEDGGKIVIVGHHRISIPNRLAPRSSPDERIHICFVILIAEYSAPYALPLCLFLPAQS
jgi:hypothetical protein